MIVRSKTLISLSSLVFAAGLLGGCQSPRTSTIVVSPGSSAHAAAQAANTAFLQQKPFDPWILTSNDPQSSIPAYWSNGRVGVTINAAGQVAQEFQAGNYQHGVLKAVNGLISLTGVAAPANAARQVLDMRQGTLTVTSGPGKTLRYGPAQDWPNLWRKSDIVIQGDPEAQQATHANLFYLLSSTYPGSTDSIPPMGLSSDVYLGHIFWDADIWMLPALIAQHPEAAKTIVAYRLKMLPQARRNAQAHGFPGAQYPWESADTGKEEVHGEFTQELHITADVDWSAWQYYLWTGDQAFLKQDAWPILQSTAQYWTSRVTKSADGRYHLKDVLAPDETAGPVNDDAYTNAVVQYALRAAARAAKLVGGQADPRWQVIADHLVIPFDHTRGIPAENDAPLTDRFEAKQADTLLLVYPLNGPYSPAVQAKMLNFYATHTIKTGPAMTSSIEAVIAARLGLSAQSLTEFQDSYAPFERGPWDAFSEKRNSSNVYFLTGMAGCLQSVLYGFGGLHVYEAGTPPTGTRIAGDSVAALYADPHLPPGWTGLTLKGVHFRGKTLDVTITAGNKVQVKPEAGA
jgi:trehalose/maltose hydrolase-like predicted phosphorylase